MANMATAMTSPNAQCLALQDNIPVICNTLTTHNIVRRFADKLTTEGLLGEKVKISIIDSSKEQFDMGLELLQAVQTQIQADPAKFDDLLRILKSEAVLETTVPALLKTLGTPIIRVLV